MKQVRWWWWPSGALGIGVAWLFREQLPALAATAAVVYIVRLFQVEIRMLLRRLATANEIQLDRIGSFNGLGGDTERSSELLRSYERARLRGDEETSTEDGGTVGVQRRPWLSHLTTLPIRSSGT